MALPIVWAKPQSRGKRLRGDKTYRCVVTETPKGIRFNSAFSHRLEKQHVRHLAVGFVDELGLIVIKPVYSDEGYALIGNEHARQISAVSAYNWMLEHGFADKIGQRIVGEFDEDEGMYVFNVMETE